MIIIGAQTVMRHNVLASPDILNGRLRLAFGLGKDANLVTHLVQSHIREILRESVVTRQSISFNLQRGDKGAVIVNGEVLALFEPQKSVGNLQSVIGDVLLGGDVDDYLAVLLAPLLGEAGAQNRDFTVLTGVQAVALLPDVVTAVLVVVILIRNGERRLIRDILSCRGIGSRCVSNGRVCGGRCVLG